MAHVRTITEVESWFAERLVELEAREREAWEEYLHTVRASEGTVYEQAEALAWRRLRRTMASLAHDRRRLEFERDRAVAEIRGLRLAN
jgi:hypothetical protein